jgi:hypothetical protein
MSSHHPDEIIIQTSRTTGCRVLLLASREPTNQDKSCLATVLLFAPSELRQGPSICRSKTPIEARQVGGFRAGEWSCQSSTTLTSMIRLLSTQPSNRALLDLKSQEKFSCTHDPDQRPSMCHQPSALEVWYSSTRKTPIRHVLGWNCPISLRESTAFVCPRAKLLMDRTQSVHLISIAPRMRSTSRSITKLVLCPVAIGLSHPNDRDMAHFAMNHQMQTSLRWPDHGSD